MFHDKAWRTGEGDGGSQLIRDVTAAEVSMRHVGLPAVLIIESLKRTKEKVNHVCTFIKITECFLVVAFDIQGAVLLLDKIRQPSSFDLLGNFSVGMSQNLG